MIPSCIQHLQPISRLEATCIFGQVAIEMAEGLFVLHFTISSQMLKLHLPERFPWDQPCLVLQLSVVATTTISNQWSMYQTSGLRIKPVVYVSNQWSMYQTSGLHTENCMNAEK